MVAPAPADPTAPGPALFRVGGLSVLVRALLALWRAGVKDLTVVAEGPKDSLVGEVRRDARLKETRFLTPAEVSAHASLSGGFLLVSADRVFSSEALADLFAAAASEKGCVFLNGEDGRFAGLAHCPASLGESIATVLGGLGDLTARLASVLPSAGQRPLQRGFIQPIRSAAEAREAEDRLLKSLPKETDSFLTRHIDRRISLPITRRLARSGITPNQVTLLHFCIGLMGAALFAQPVRWIQVLGALLFLFSSTVDGCDGEIARLKFQQSRLGGWLDIGLDNLVHMAVFAAIAIGLYRQTPADRFLWLGALSCLGVLLSTGLVFWTVLRFKSGEGDFFVSVAEGVEKEAKPEGGSAEAKKDWARGIDDYLARRDFIYLLVLLAALGKLEWFLWASAVGGNLFFLSLVVLYCRARPS